MQQRDISKIRGFNYHPSYAYTGADIWRAFDAEVFRRELGWGKKHFSAMNGLRLWLAWEVYAHASEAEREVFLKNVDCALGIAANLGLPVMLVLFNRWHGGRPDWGGVYIDHIIPGTSWGEWHFETAWKEYIAGVIGRFGTDPRIFSWDLCNEPFTYSKSEDHPDFEALEASWLEAVYAECKRHGAVAPLSVGFWSGTKFLQKYEHLSDILNFHQYLMSPSDVDLDKYRRDLDACVALREKTSKPLICSEACWGAIDDQQRAMIIEQTLPELNQREIGWLIYALQHTHIADLHRPGAGAPLTQPGDLHCVGPDGAIRPGHEVINRFF